LKGISSAFIFELQIGKLRRKKTTTVLWRPSLKEHSVKRLLFEERLNIHHD